MSCPREENVLRLLGSCKDPARVTVLLNLLRQMIGTDVLRPPMTRVPLETVRWEFVYDELVKFWYLTKDDHISRELLGTIRHLCGIPEFDLIFKRKFRSTFFPEF
jgi:hypothetical protein